MKQNKIFKFYSDDGHGWLAVKRSYLADLGLLDKITRFSYSKGQTVYLEEDCDCAAFFKAFELKYGSKPQYETVDVCGRSPIRSYQRFQNETV